MWAYNDRINEQSESPVYLPHHHKEHRIVLVRGKDAVVDGVRFLLQRFIQR